MDPLRDDLNQSLTPVSQEPRVLDLPRPQVSYGYTNIPAHQSGMLMDVWRILKKRMWIIAAIMLVVFAMITIWTFRTVPLYEATARISISKETNDSIGINNRNNTDSDPSYDINMELDTQARILSGDTLALQVIDSQHLAENPAFYHTAAQTQQ